MPAIVLREGPAEGAYQTFDELHATYGVNGTELHVPATIVTKHNPAQPVMAIYRRAPAEPGIDAPIWQYHRYEPVYRTK